jgi:hypothetical protein
MSRGTGKRDVDDRAGVDLLDHDMDRGAELRCPLVKREMRRRPAGVIGRTRMEIDGAVTELRKNARRDNFRGHERDQPRPFKQIRIERGQIGRICGR